MQRHPSLFTLLAGCGLLLLSACGDPPDPVGPSTGSLTYHYNNSFDTAVGLGEWQTYQRGGTGSIALSFDTSAFQSPPRSLMVSVAGSVFSDSLAYVPASFVAGRDLWLEFDWLLAGMTGENEVVLNQGGVNRASIGYNGTGVFLTHNGVRYFTAPPIATGQWHHVRMMISGSTGLSSYWIDNLSIGTNYNTAITPIGAPTVDYVGIKLAFNAGDQVRVDNLQAYRNQ